MGQASLHAAKTTRDPRDTLARLDYELAPPAREIFLFYCFILIFQLIFYFQNLSCLLSQIAFLIFKMM